MICTKPNSIGRAGRPKISKNNNKKNDEKVNSLALQLTALWFLLYISVFSQQSTYSFVGINLDESHHVNHVRIKIAEATYALSNFMNLLPSKIKYHK